MKTTAVARLAVLTVVCFALVIAACGDDDDNGGGTTATETPASLEQYFRSLKEVFDEADEATEEAQAELNEVPGNASVEEQIEAIDVYLAQVETIFGDAIERLGEIAVPDEAQEYHADFTGAAKESLEASSVLREDLAGIETQEALDARLDEFDTESESAVETANSACFALQDLADAEEIDIDLDCEE